MQIFCTKRYFCILILLCLVSSGIVKNNLQGTSPANPHKNKPFETSASPQINFFSLRGTYFLKANANLPTIILVIDQQYIQFQGCNIQRIPYVAYTDGLFGLLVGGSSTFRQCILDNDKSYITFLESINNFQTSSNNNGYDFYNDGDFLGSIEVKNRNKVVLYSDISGGYQLSVQGPIAYVSHSSISFSPGCNQISVNYRLNNGNIYFGPAVQTLKFCDNDFDDIYTKALRTGSRLREIPEGYSLLDSQGVETLRFLKYQKSYYDDKFFGGKYKLQLPSAGIRLKISEGTFTLQGCNSFEFKFSLSDDGTIIFKAPSGTKTSCDLDTDKAFLFVILQAQSVAVVNKNIIFFNGKNQQIAIGYNFDLSKGNPRRGAVIDKTSPIVSVVDYYLENGNYKLSLLRSSIKSLTLTINNNIINVKGCNSFSMSYIASSDGLINFYKQTGPTKRGCKQDYDSFFFDGLLSVTKFTESKGVYTFYDKNGKSILSFTSDFGLGFFGQKQPQKPDSLQFRQEFYDLSGSYRLLLAKTSFQIVSKAFIFKGCNTHRVSFTVNFFKIIIGKVISSKKQCTVDNDEVFLGLIEKINTFTRNNDNIIFQDSDSNPLFIAEFIASNNRPQIVPGLSTGKYQLIIPEFNIDIDEQRRISLGNCQYQFDYSAKTTGWIQITEKSENCDSRNYIFASRALKSSRKYRNSNTGFILDDEDGNEQGRCIKV